MDSLPSDHPARLIAADEVHARPQQALDSPQRATYLAVIIDPEEREREHAHVVALCTQCGVATPRAHTSHFNVLLGEARLQWERHGEFSSYLITAPGESSFSEPATRLLPEGWMAAIPGRTIVAADAKLIPAEVSVPSPDALSEQFAGNDPVGALVGDGAGSAFTDFRIHADGHVRFFVQDVAFTPRQAGRTLQRLFEIEAYRVMALLALPIARRLGPRMVEIERALGSLTEAIARESGSDEVLLGELTKLAAEVEMARNASQMRFQASTAYYDLVRTRIAELRERRVPGIQTIDAFMTRRLAPAMATCTSVSQRLHDLAERVAHASGLLSTRVEIARERQNQTLLASLDQRARLQLRLQQTVEWLSVAAVTYYGAGLVGYACKAMKAAGVPVNPDIAVGVSIPVIGALVVLALRRVRHKADASAAAGS